MLFAVTSVAGSIGIASTTLSLPPGVHVCLAVVVEAKGPYTTSAAAIAAVVLLLY